MIRDFLQFSKDTLFAIAAGLSLVFAAEPYAIQGLGFAFPVFFSLALRGRAEAIPSWGARRLLHDEGAATRGLGLEGAPAQGITPYRAFALGLIAGMTMQLGAFAWIPGLLIRFADFPWPLAWLTASLLYLAQSLPWALAAMFAIALERAGTSRAIALGLSLLLFAYSIPTLFPWRPADVLTSSALPFAQLAELGGAPLVDLAFTAAGLSFLELARSREARAIFAAAIVLPSAFGLARISAIEAEEGETISVGVIQPNISIEEKHDPESAFPNLRKLKAMSLDIEREGAELILWPESAYPFPLHRERRRDHAGEYSLRPAALEVPIIAGALTQRGGCDRWNSVIALDGDGEIIGVTDKLVLLAFGEFAPLHAFYPEWLKEKVPCPGFVRGEREPTLDVGGVRYGVLNCYEDLLAARSRALALEGSSVLLNFTNDAWFGDTAEPHLHHMVSRLRTIETRRELIRAVNTGVSAHVSKTGRDLIRTETFIEAAFIAEARPSERVTVYMRFGDWLSPILMGLMLAIGLLALMRWRYQLRLERP